MDFETMHKNALKDIEDAQAKSLIRIANALEVIALPFTLLKNELEKQTKERSSWENQARYYQEACSKKNKERNKKARIGGKGMKYIVKNCPACIISPSCCAKYHIDNGHAKDCQDVEDCVIKQVIEKCEDSKLSYSNLGILRTACETSEAYGKAYIAEQILQLFDIEEINK